MMLFAIKQNKQKRFYRLQVTTYNTYTLATWNFKKILVKHWDII